MRNILYSFLLPIVLLVSACNSTPDIQNSMLDSGQISYAISDSLQKHLVSEYINHPTLTQQNTPVLIAAHGHCHHF